MSANVPELRFSGFADPWEQRKLGEFGSVEMCKRIYKEQTSESGEVPFFKIGTFGSEPDAFISNKLYESYRDEYPYPEPGTPLISAAGSIGRTVVYQGERAYYQDSNIVWLDHDDNLDNSFLDVFYSQVDWKLEGSTIKRLYNKDILNAEVCVPSLPEQRAVGALFSRLDSLIALHQRKHNQLSVLKGSLLEGMFPKPGSDVPELRFSGFADPWEQRKLVDIALRQTVVSDDPALPTVEYEDINPGEGTLNKNLSTKATHKSGVLFNAGDILYGKLRPYLHNWLHPQFKGIAVGDFWVLEPQRIDGRFVYCLIQSGRFSTLADVSAGSKMPRADWKLISESKFSIPTNVFEQRAVGALFSRLDSLIALHQRKLEKLRALKQSLLQKMFV